MMRRRRHAATIVSCIYHLDKLAQFVLARLEFDLFPSIHYNQLSIRLEIISQVIRVKQSSL